MGNPLFRARERAKRSNRSVHELCAIGRCLVALRILCGTAPASHATFASARAGTLAALRSARTDDAASLDAIAIAAAVLGATPLVVARIAGVL
jgi:hypothetical protein